MSDPLLEDYKAYYQVRAERYADNPNYRNSYEAEKNLSAAMQSCHELIEFKDRIGNLNELCANALTKDKYIMFRNFQKENQETVRVLGPERILEKVDQFEKVLDLITMVTNEETFNMREISMDEANRHFHYYWKLVDFLEVLSMAEMPVEWHSERKKSYDEILKILIESVNSLETYMDAWQPGWKHNPSIVTEHRHRRLLPYKDEDIQEQLQKYRNFINR